MATRYFALVWGILFLVITASGVIPGAWVPAPAHYPHIAVDSMYGAAMATFPVNILHNLVHLVFGIWGVLAYRKLDSSRTYAKAVAIAYGMFAIMGMIPVLDTTFGLVPLFGNDVWLHIFLAAPAIYFGFMRNDARDASRA
jgi:hypothetical protein